MDPQRSG